MALPLVLALAGVGGCGDDGDSGGGAEGGGTTEGTTDSDALGANPSADECFDATRSMFERVEVPDIDLSDGADDAEREATDAAIDDAVSEAGFDPDDQDHPCNAVFDALPDAEAEAYIAELEADFPEVMEMLGASAVQEFSSIAESLD